MTGSHRQRESLMPMTPPHTNSLVAWALSVRNEKLESLALPRSFLNWNKPHIRFHRFQTARKLTPKLFGDYCPLFCMEFIYCVYVKLKLYPVTLKYSASCLWLRFIKMYNEASVLGFCIHRSVQKSWSKVQLVSWPVD